jgi:hypothetical protein
MGLPHASPFVRSLPRAADPHQHNKRHFRHFAIRASTVRPGRKRASHNNAADAGMVVARVYGVPTAIEKDFGPGAEIHRTDISRNADVAEIAGALRDKKVAVRSAPSDGAELKITSPVLHAA